MGYIDCDHCVFSHFELLALRVAPEVVDHHEAVHGHHIVRVLRQIVELPRIILNAGAKAISLAYFSQVLRISLLKPANKPRILDVSVLLGLD